MGVGVQGGLEKEWHRWVQASEGENREQCIRVKKGQWVGDLFKQPKTFLAGFHTEFVLGQLAEKVAHHVTVGYCSQL